MTVIASTAPSFYYIKSPQGCHVIASDYNENKKQKKNKANNLIKSMKFLDQLNCFHLLEKYIRDNFKMGEFTKSLLSKYIVLCRNGVKRPQVWGSLNKNQ